MVCDLGIVILKRNVMRRRSVDGVVVRGIELGDNDGRAVELAVLELPLDALNTVGRSRYCRIAPLDCSSDGRQRIPYHSIYIDIQSSREQCAR